jgi:hypothetical protein
MRKPRVERREAFCYSISSAISLACSASSEDDRRWSAACDAFDASEPENGALKRKEQPAYCILSPVRTCGCSCCLARGLKQFACTIEQRADPQNERQIIEHPAFGWRKPAGDRTEVPHLPLASESHHQVGADCVDEKDVEDDRFDVHIIISCA